MCTGALHVHIPVHAHVQIAIFVTISYFFTGHETKAMLNNSGPRAKRSKLERDINAEIVSQVIILFALCFFGAVCECMSLCVSSSLCSHLLLYFLLSLSVSLSVTVCLPIPLPPSLPPSLTLFFFFSIASGIWTGKRIDRNIIYFPFSSESANPALEGFIRFWTFVIILQVR